MNTTIIWSQEEERCIFPFKKWVSQGSKPKPLTAAIYASKCHATSTHWHINFFDVLRRHQWIICWKFSAKIEIISLTGGGSRRRSDLQVRPGDGVLEPWRWQCDSCRRPAAYWDRKFNSTSGGFCYYEVSFYLKRNCIWFYRKNISFSVNTSKP